MSQITEKFVKTSTLIARICEDYTDSNTCTIKLCPNFTQITFGWTSGEIITYRILKNFYEENLRSIFEENYKKSLFFNL